MKFLLIFAVFPCFLTHKYSKPRIPSPRITRAACTRLFFSLEQSENIFFGAQQVANLAKSVPNFSLKFGNLIIVKLNSNFLAKRYMYRQLFDGRKKLGEIDPK